MIPAIKKKFSAPAALLLVRTGSQPENPQVFLWVSGHTHTSPLEESFTSPVNVYKGQVTNIHNKDMNRGDIWTNSIFLYPDKVVVKTWDYQTNSWLPLLERVIPVPKL